MNNNDRITIGKRRLRTNFSDDQSAALECAFAHSHYPDQLTKRAMSIALCIPEHRITVWFQNRRAKWRRKITNNNSSLLLKRKTKNNATTTINDNQRDNEYVDTNQIDRDDDDDDEQTKSIVSYGYCMY